MTWWVLTYLANDRSQTGLTVLAATNHPAHLFMAWSTIKPTRTPIYRTVRGKRIFCGYRLKWNTPNLVEQTQPLDTFEHIFVTTPLLPSDHVWYFLSSSRTMFERYCQSALFHVWPPEIQMASARIFHSAPQPCPSGAYTVLTFDSVLWDDYNFYDPTDPTKLTLPAGALYTLGASVRLTTATAMLLSLSIRLNAAYDIAYHGHQVSAVAFGGGRISTQTLIRLHPGDFIQCRLYHNAGIARDTVPTAQWSPHFWVRLVGAYPL